jgi:uncharacterized iron-regulated protein
MKPSLHGLLLSCAAADAEPIGLDALAEMAATDIVILGEVHDNPAHHQGQAYIINHLGPRAVVFEMLSSAQAATLNSTSFDTPEALAEVINWADSGWPDFAIYAPIFAALGKTPVAGAALPKSKVRQAFGEGAATVFGVDAPTFGLDRPLTASELERRMQMQFEAHCQAMPLDMMGGMVEAQRLRDAYFSRVALEALKTHKAPIVVIAGNGHARRDWGMPGYIALAASDISVMAIGFVEEPAAVDDPRFDLTIPTAPATRPDPCDTFKKG